MMKKRKTLLTVFAAFLLQTALWAQTTDFTYENGTTWPGHNVSKIADAQSRKHYLNPDRTKNAVPANDDNTLYLVNVAAFKEAENTRCFFNHGGHWGTEALLFEVGIPVYMEYVGEQSSWGPKVRLLISPEINDKEDNHIGEMVDEKPDENGNITYVTADDRGVFIDLLTAAQNTKSVSRTEWVLSTGDKYKAAENQYYIYTVAGNRCHYLGYQGGSGIRKHIIATTEMSSLSRDYQDDKYRWVIVTRSDLLERFNESAGNFKTMADATFLLNDQNLSREDGKADSWIKETFEGNDFPPAAMKVGNNLSDRSEGKKTPGDVDQYILKEEDKAYTYYPNFYRIHQGHSPVYNVMYGQFYNAEIKGGVGGWKQTVQLPDRSGFYMVTLQGFHKPGDGSGESRAGVFVQTFNDKGELTYEGAETLPLWKEGDPEDLTSAGIKFFEDEDNFKVKALVWANPHDKLEISVLAFGLSGNYAEDWTAFDNVQLKYLGGIFPVFEDFEKIEDYGHYGRQDYKTMVLKRKFQMREWNSLILPVELTKEQVVDAFGEEVKLAELSGLDNGGRNIAFASIDLSAKGKDEIVIGKNQPYLIWPVKEGRSDFKITWPKLISNGKELVTDGPHYIIPVVSINPDDIRDLKDMEKPLSGTDMTITLKPNLYATIRNQIQASADNYIYVMNKGALTRYKKPFALNGTRWYLEYSEQPAEAKLTITDRSVVTAIESVTEKGNAETKTGKDIYNLNGQKLSSGVPAEKLPQGIYIVDGKKVAVY